MRRFYVLTAPFVSRLRKFSGFYSQDTIHPAETAPVTPPWISTASQERIIEAHHMSNLQKEMQVITQTTSTHAPVVRFTQGPGIVGPDGYATFGSRLKVLPSFTRNAFTRPLNRVGSVTYVNAPTSWRYFGHWLADGLPQTLLARDQSYYLSNPKSWTHCVEYRKVLGLKQSDQDYLSADEIITYSDFSQGSFKRQRYEVLKKLISNQMPSPRPSKKVFLWRGDSGVARQFQDSDRVRDTLLSEGWQIVDVTAPLQELYVALADTDLVAGMEGSHLNHVHFCTRSGTPLVILMPQDIFTSVHVGRARAFGNYTGIVVLEGSKLTGYRLNINDLIEACEKTADIAARSPML